MSDSEIRKLRFELAMLRARYDCGQVSPPIWNVIREIETTIAWAEHHRERAPWQEGDVMMHPDSGMSVLNNSRRPQATEAECVAWRRMAAEELDAICKEMARRGIIVDTGRKRWEPISGACQTVWTLAPGVTEDEFRRLRDREVGEA